MNSKRHYVVDTCSFVKQFRDPACALLFDKLIIRGQFVLSSIVAMELYAGIKNKQAKSALDALATNLAPQGLVITPTHQEYVKAGAMLRAYAAKKGQVKSSPHFRDILICLSALRLEAAVITENTDDVTRWAHQIKRSFNKKIEIVATQQLL